MIVVNFHGIGEPRRRLDPGESSVWITRDSFRRVLDAILSIKAVQITFDDGNISDVEVAMPELQARGMTAVFFVCAGRVAEGTNVFLAGPELRDLISAGMTIGSHGWAHTRWPCLNEMDLHHELTDAREYIQSSIGTDVVDAACPFGAYNRRVLTGLRQAGFATVYTSDRCHSRPGHWLRPRYTVHSDDLAEDIALWSRRPDIATRSVDQLRCALKRWR